MVQAVPVTRVARLASQHIAVCKGNAVMGVYVTRRQARRAQRRYNRRYSGSL